MSNNVNMQPEQKNNAALQKSTWLRSAGESYMHMCFCCRLPVSVFEFKVSPLYSREPLKEKNSSICCPFCAVLCKKVGGSSFVRHQLLNGKLKLKKLWITNSKKNSFSESSFSANPPKFGRKSMNRVNRMVVWEKIIGSKFKGGCSCCHLNITPFDFHVAHKTSLAKGGTNEYDNLLPTCSTCNLSMGTKSIEDFQEICGYSKQGGSWCIII